MSKNKTYTLESGREVTLRQQTAMDTYRINGYLPDTSEEGGCAEVSTSRVYEMGIRSICMLSVEPKFWADFRTLDELDADPMECPEGRVEFDLTDEEFAELMTAIKEDTEARIEEARPLSETEPVS